MKRVCGWCQQELGQSPKNGSEEVITHGLCADCKFHLFAQMGMPLREYLDGLGVPVAVVDETGRVKTASEQACRLLQKKRADVEGYLGGDVFECEYAKLPGGCGHTIHCSGCTIRRTVTKTFESEKSQYRVPAYLNQATPEGTHQVELLISTEKVRDAVLLRIDQIGGQPAI